MAQESDFIKRCIATFPSEFGLRAFPGKRFRISERSSYFSDHEGILLYTEIFSAKGGMFTPDADGWLSFAKEAPSVLRQEVVALKGE